MARLSYSTIQIVPEIGVLITVRRESSELVALLATGSAVMSASSQAPPSITCNSGEPNRVGFRHHSQYTEEIIFSSPGNAAQISRLEKQSSRFGWSAVRRGLFKGRAGARYGTASS